VIPQQKWFERAWAFTLPPSQSPNIVERLRGTPGRLEERTGGVAGTLLTRRDGEAWSIQEQAGHLLDLEPLWLRRAEQLLAGEATLVAADLTNQKTREAEHNARVPADILREFRAAITALRRRWGVA
jgi:hypothetical protein